MVGSPFARAEQAPGRGYHWGSEAHHPDLPRGARVKVGTIGTLEQILHGPSTVADGSLNLVGALRRTMATSGYSDLKEFQRVEVVVTSERAAARRAAGIRLGASVRPVMAGGADAARLGPDSQVRRARRARRDRAPGAGRRRRGGRRGVALDAATRGLSVGLVEARDFGAGTSSRSSKLIHGGLRYLEQLNFGLVREALTERSLLLGVIAPHLVRPGALPLPAHPPRLGAGLRRHRGRAPTTRSACRSARPGACPATASCPGAPRCGRPRAQAVGHHRRARLLGRAGGRRPLRAHPGPHRGRRTARRWRPGSR